jgi:archaellum component FlaF (FlaF/FlaG flagellin family)
MAINLKQINAQEFHPLSDTQVRSKLTQTIIAVYLCIAVVVSIGTWFSLYQNWTLRVEDAKANLTRSANIGNYLIETALTSAAKSLDNTQTSFERVLQFR